MRKNPRLSSRIYAPKLRLLFLTVTNNHRFVATSQGHFTASLSLLLKVIEFALSMQCLLVHDHSISMDNSMFPSSGQNYILGLTLVSCLCVVIICSTANESARSGATSKNESESASRKPQHYIRVLSGRVGRLR